MYNFFATEENLKENGYIIFGDDFNHIANVLRMKTGDNFYVSFDGKTDLCKIDEITTEDVTVSIIEKDAISTELPIQLKLFFGMPKGDKTEAIIQKAVELGVSEIQPILMKRTIVRLDEKKRKTKAQRYQSIAEAAAKQSKRNIIPKVCEIQTFAQVKEEFSKLDLFIVPYESEHGMADTKKVLSMIKSGMKTGVLIGPEGGFAPEEITVARQLGGKVVSLGNRILRVETAAITALSMIMLKAEMGDENG